MLFSFHRLAAAGYFSSSLLLALAPVAAWAQAPYLTGFNPARYAVSAPVAGPVRATFGAPPAAGVVAGLQVLGNLGHGRQSGSATLAGSTFTFQPGAPFAPGERVSVSVPGAGSAQPGVVYEFLAAASPAAATFGPRQVLAVGVLPSSVAPLDFEGDGDLDLAVANAGTGGTSGTGMVTFYRNNGRGSFVATAQPVAGKYADAIIAADLDLDGDLDLLYSQFYFPHVRALLNDGTGNFTYLNSFDGGSAELLTADLNGDGYPDFASSTDDVNGITVGINTSSTSGFVATPLAATLQMGCRAIADLDGNGTLDLVASPIFVNNQQTTFYFNNGRGQFSVGPTLPLPTIPSSVVAADIDHDGWPDLVMTAFATVRTLYYCRNRGNGTFAAPVAQPLGTIALGRLTAADLNGDGDLDLLMPSGSVVRVLLGNGTGQFAAGPVLATSGHVARAHAADLNGDGRLDVLAAVDGSNTVEYFFNQAAVPTATAAGRAAPGLSIYPNPSATGRVRLDWPATALALASPPALKLCNVLGQTVRAMSLPAGASTAELDMHGLPPGLYHVLLSRGGPPLMCPLMLE